MTDSSSDRLRQQVAGRSAALLAAFEQNPEAQLPTDELESVERLARLLALRERAERAPSRRRRWPPLLILLLTLSLTSGLLFLRVPSTKIVLDAEVSELRFELASRSALNELVRLTSLRAAGFDSARWPHSLGSDTGIAVGRDRGEQAVVLRIVPA